MESAHKPSAWTYGIPDNVSQPNQAAQPANSLSLQQYEQLVDAHGKPAPDTV